MSKPDMFLRNIFAGKFKMHLRTWVPRSTCSLGSGGRTCAPAPWCRCRLWRGAARCRWWAAQTLKRRHYMKFKTSLHEVKDTVLWACINLGTIFYQGGSEHWRGKFHFQCASPQKPKAVFSCNLGLSTFYGQEYIILRASPGLGVQAPPQM